MQNIEQQGFAPYINLMPAVAVAQPMGDILRLLEQRFGPQLYAVFEQLQFPSPVAGEPDTTWLKRAKTVGINVRTLGSFWGIIPYAMTLPRVQNAIHLLPVFEPGVVSSLYGPTSWHINPEFYDPQLASFFPHLNTPEKQLSLVIALLHLMGKAVGMDVIPHVDRYAEQSLANPAFFEWIRREDTQITDHHAALHQQVELKLFQFVQQNGSATPGITVPDSCADFFALPENIRLLCLFGEPSNYSGRLERRKMMVDLLYRDGLETLPATMGPPYRGIEVDPNPDAKITDLEGRVWRDYRITNPQKFSRVFGPLARYKLYEPLDDNRNWQLDFDHPNVPAWDYVCQHYAAVVRSFDVDFMRGDMSHVQMRPSGTPPNPDRYYDLLAAVKMAVLKEKPYFGYFAESFLAPPGEMAYGDECDHLEASLADSALGDLQSEPVGTAVFIREFTRYIDLLRNRRFAPNFTLMTADKDDPRFDGFYLYGNEVRYFLGLFLADMPSYMGLGFECRDVHHSPAPNEHYTKLYVFQESVGPKATKGPFLWGKNVGLYENIARQKALSEALPAFICKEKTRWLSGPDSHLLIWTQEQNPCYIFAANLSREALEFSNSGMELYPNRQLIFSSLHQDISARRVVGENWLEAEECLVWKIL